MHATTPADPDALSLVEREQELATLAGVLAAARSGTGTAVLIEGPAGIGKTTLVAHARARAAQAGMRVLHARATELEREYPLGVVRQCLGPAVRREGDRAGLLTGAARLAGPVLLDAPAAVEAAPVGILHGLYWLVANLADEAPLLLAIDDAQWADEPSLRFLAYLARRAESLPVALLIGTRGDEDTRPGSASVLAGIRTDAETVRIEPAALAIAGVERFLAEFGADRVDAAFARACDDATGGNPFLLGELVRALRADGVPFTAAGAVRVTEVTPPTVARAVGATLARLGPPATALAQAAAVLGEGSALELAAQLAELPPGAARGVAADLVRARILDDAPELRFRHPILAGAVTAGATAHERALTHARAAEILRAGGAPVERIALHLLHAPPSGDAGAVEELRLAAEHSRERGAPATAAELLRRALDEPPDPALRGELAVRARSRRAGDGESARGRRASDRIASLRRRPRRAGARRGAARADDAGQSVR